MTAAVDVLVWWTTLQDARWSTSADSPDPLLCEVERDRWSAYRRPDDRRRFTAGVVLCRELVAGRSGGAAAAVRILRTCPTCGAPHGRPVVPGGPHLSVSHSGDVVVVAAAPVPVGVDVEPRARADEMADVRALLLAPGDVPTDAPEHLLHLWVRKEAVLKAAGVGLRTPMTSFALTTSGSVVGADGPPTDLEVVDLELPGVSAALATRGAAATVRTTQYAPAAPVVGHPIRGSGDE